MPERCPITELLTDQCAHCRRLPELDPPAVSKPFIAAYGGCCHTCGRRYDAGDRIQRIHDDDGPGYLGPCCAEETP